MHALHDHMIVDEEVWSLVFQTINAIESYVLDIIQLDKLYSRQQFQKMDIIKAIPITQLRVWRNVKV